jgi:dTDP-4-dehydrorhamnose 3,5-epimerase
MKVSETSLPGVLVIEPEVHRDTRGFFVETWHAQRYLDAGVPGTWVQDNLSRSSLGTLRGLHWQDGRPQGKLIRVVEGTVFDVAVDIRRESPTFGRWMGVELSAVNHLQCYVPPGFAHGFCVTSGVALVEYKCTDYYSRDDERGLVWNDPDLGIAWPIDRPILSARDRSHPTLAQLFGTRAVERSSA